MTSFIDSFARRTDYSSTAASVTHPLRHSLRGARTERASVQFLGRRSKCCTTDSWAAEVFPARWKTWFLIWSLRQAIGIQKIAVIILGNVAPTTGLYRVLILQERSMISW